MTSRQIQICMAGRAFGDTKLLSPFCAVKIGKRRLKLTEDLLVWKKPFTLLFPKGFEWDGTSRPFFAEWFVSRWDFQAASGAHDWCFGYHCVQVVIHDDAGIHLEWWSCSKFYADTLFMELTHDVYECKKMKARILFAAIASFGWLSWWTGTCAYQCAEPGGTCSQRVGCPIVGLAGNPPKIMGELK